MQKIALSFARRARGGGNHAFRALARRHGGRVQESARSLSSFSLPGMREQGKWPQRRSFSTGTSAAEMRPNFVLWKDTGALKVASMQGSLNAQGFMDRPGAIVFNFFPKNPSHGGGDYGHEQSQQPKYLTNTDMVVFLFPMDIGQIIADLRRGPAHEAEIVKLAPAFVKERQGIPEDERLERRVRIVNAAAAGTGEGVTVEYTCGTETCSVAMAEGEWEAVQSILSFCVPYMYGFHRAFDVFRPPPGGGGGGGGGPPLPRGVPGAPY